MKPAGVEHSRCDHMKPTESDVDRGVSAIVSLLVRSRSLSAPSISARLRMKPTTAMSAGDLVPEHLSVARSRGITTSATTLWRKKPPASWRPLPLTSQVRKWIRLLDQRASAIRSMNREGALAELDCMIRARSVRTCFRLPSDVSTSLGRLGLVLVVTIYNGDEVD